MKNPICVLVLAALSAAYCGAQSDKGQQDYAERALHEAFVGKQVLLKLDLPGSQKGVDLNFEQSDPLEWKDYENRIRQFGTAIHKGEVATVTSLVVKNDHIEFHLDGGGYGTVHDDTGSISPRAIPKSSEQEQLEKSLRNETDKDRRRDLQDRINYMEGRRREQQSRENSAAMVAQQIKQQEIADRRLLSGSRFNLRWKGAIPPQELSAAAVRMRLAAYINFDNNTEPQPPMPTQPQPQRSTSPTPGNANLNALHRGMNISELMNLLGTGQLVSQETNSNGMLTQEMLYETETSRVHVTLVDSIVIRYTIESR